MIEKYDGGAAFPTPVDTGHDTNPWHWTGMTLRDWFAGFAMQEYLNDPPIGATQADVAAKSYRMADAMLKERARKGETE